MKLKPKIGICDFILSRFDAKQWNRRIKYSREIIKEFTVFETICFDV